MKLSKRIDPKKLLGFRMALKSDGPNQRALLGSKLGAKEGMKSGARLGAKIGGKENPLPRD